MEVTHPFIPSQEGRPRVDPLLRRVRGLLLITFVLVTTTVFSQINLIPKPQLFRLQQGLFKLNSDVRIQFNPDKVSAPLRLYVYFLHDLDLKVEVSSMDSNRRGGVILFKEMMDNSDYAYTIEVSPKEVIIEYTSEQSALSAVQTLRQFYLQNDSNSIPCIEIGDFYHFPHRGLLLDCSRHFFSVETVKKYIDLLAFYKMNVLHWHLTEDQGWRIEIDKYPKLTEIAAWRKDENGDWFSQTWSYTKQIMPLLLGGVLIAGLLLGRPGHEGLIPTQWISQSVGGNSIGANLFASGAGALMYFATLTEVPILQGLLGNGMGSGPALALLLAGPALSLPNMLVINSVIGPKKTASYVLLVVVMATLTGWLYGMYF